jgi:phosphoglycolate phosphatase
MSRARSPSQRLAIFDLDGTLVDSLPDIAAALNAALHDAGLEAFALDEAARMVGHGARLLVQRALIARGQLADTSRIDALWAAFVSHYDAHPCDLTRLYPGALAALDALAADRWALALCTNKPEAIAQQVLDALGITDRFVSIIGGQDGLPLKPAPDMVLLNLCDANVMADRAVMIGDSPADFEAARAAGIPVILMSHGYSSVPVATLGADATLDHFDHLLPALKGIIA